MTPADALANLAAFTAQLALVVLAARALEAVLPIDRPRVRLAYWQAVLAFGLLLPFVQPWRAVTPPLPEATPVSRVAPADGASTRAEGAPTAPIARRERSLPALVFGLLALGAMVAAIRLCLAVRALARARRRSQRLPPDAAAPGVELRLSGDVRSPVTYGIRPPVILLPHAFLRLGAEEQRSVVYHENVHVERHHWLAQAFEELLRVVLWFHPAFHWLLGRLRLAREQAVDAEVVQRLGGRAPYLEALVTLATSGRAAGLVPAATFFTRSHLAERVDLLLKEEPMSPVRVVFSLASSATAVALCAAGAIALVPFQASAESPAAPPVPPAPVMHIAPPTLPAVPVAVDVNVNDVPPPVPPVAAAPPAPPAPAREKRRREGGDEREAIQRERKQLEEVHAALEVARRQIEEQAARIGQEAAKMAEEQVRRVHEQTARMQEEAARVAAMIAEDHARKAHAARDEAAMTQREQGLRAKLVQMEQRLMRYEEDLAVARKALKEYEQKDTGDTQD